ncbi:MAG: BMP family ABC transporter substrate-binding protein [Burkholderiaceae bacterium]|jgi:simple sugar transport system substrate-binding protein|nr:BMP family ABC transporter substrate-binding protein [Burkholderiaceae bacterium]
MLKNLSALLLAVCLIAPCFAQSAASAPDTEPLKAVWLYVSPITHAGWTQQHEAARSAVQDAFGARVQTTVVEDVPEGGDAERVLRDLARQGHRLIFATSFGYARSVLAVARDFPQVKFECLTCPQGAPNVATANARYYEGRYLAGIAAGRVSGTHVAGYVAGYPIPEVLQGINAFTLGMRSVDPQARVKVIWLHAWFDPAREREAALTLINQGADVLAFHTGSAAVMSAAQERGKLAIAYHADMRQAAPDAQLLAITHHWGDYEKGRVQAMLDGHWESGNVWGGIKQDMVRVGDFGPKAPPAVQEEVLARQKEIAAGALTPFKAGAEPIRDNEGKVRIPPGQTLSDAEILQMNWLVEGVQGSAGQ